jgi:hypothetical protein
MRSYAAIAGVVAAAWLAMAIAEVSEAADRPGRGDQGPVPGAPESDEQEIRELQVAPPAYPRDRDLAEFTLRNQPSTGSSSTPQRSRSARIAF